MACFFFGICSGRCSITETGCPCLEMGCLFIVQREYMLWRFQIPFPHLLFRVVGVESIELEGMVIGLGVVVVVSCVEEFVMIILHPSPTRFEIELSSMEDLLSRLALWEIGYGQSPQKILKAWRMGYRDRKHIHRNPHTLPQDFTTS